MKRLTVLIMVLFAAVVGAQQKSDRQVFLTEVKVNNVNVDVLVRDEKGAPVVDLVRDNFRIFEDNVEQKVTNFVVVSGGQISTSQEAAALGQPANRIVVLFFDLYLMIERDKDLIVESLLEQYSGGLPPGEQVAVVSFDGALRVHTLPTASTSKIISALKEVDRISAVGLGRQITLNAYRTSAMDSYSARRTQNQEYWNEMRLFISRVEAALNATLERFSAFQGRKVAIFISPGFPRSESVPIYQSVDFFLDTLPDEFRNVGWYGKTALLASELEYTLFTLDPSGNIAIEGDASRGSASRFTDQVNVRFWREADRKDNLINAARLTGGEAIFSGRAGAALADVERLTATYYSLAFQPEHAGDGKMHKIRVEVVGRPKLKLSHRNQYIDRPAEQRSAERTQATLLVGEDRNPLGIELVVDKPTSRFRLGRSKTWQSKVELRIPYAKLVMLPRDTMAWGQVQIVCVSSDDQGSQSELFHQKVPIEVPMTKLEEARKRGYFAYRVSLELRSGKSKVRFGVDDLLAQETSVVNADFDL